MKPLILHTLAPDHSGDARWRDEFDLDEAAQHVAAVLENAVIAGVRGEAAELIGLIDQHRPDVIVNLCEAPLGEPALEPHAAALFEWLRLPFTGSGSRTLALCRDKPLIGSLLAAGGIAVPRQGVFPAIVKPADQDGSAGIHADSVCADAAAVERASARWPGPVLVQEFLPGREFAVSLWGAGGPEQVSIGETLFRNGVQLNTYASKWNPDCAEYIDSPLEYDTAIDPPLRERIVAAARGAWQLCGAWGYLRVDIRGNAQGEPCVIDVNPNPAIGPGIGICRAVDEAGWHWADFVQLQLACALARRGGGLP